ncbi:MAG: methyltransferase family protein [Longimicrobiales bacterium]
MAETQPGKPRDSARVFVPPPFIYVAVFLVALLLERWVPLGQLPRQPARVAALVCAVLWALLMLPAFALFLANRTGILPVRPATALVTSGPYRFTRNPMYLGLVFLYLAIALWFDVAWALILLPVVVIIVQLAVITREEAYLERRFGEDYRAYRRRVRRWL